MKRPDLRRLGSRRPALRRPTSDELRTAAGRAREAAGQAATTAVAPLGSALRSRRAGDERSIAHRPELDAPTTISVASTAFADGQEIPSRHCGPGIGEGISPALAWDGVPEGTRRLLIVLEDLDHPSTRHTGILAAAVLDATGAEGALPEGWFSRGNPALTWLKDYRGRRGYVGPRPLPGHGEHRYVVHVVAIDTPIMPPAGTGLAAFVPMIAGRVTARGTLLGTRTA